jgi:hypothetical protein
MRTPTTGWPEPELHDKNSSLDAADDLLYQLKFGCLLAPEHLFFRQQLCKFDFLLQTEGIRRILRTSVSESRIGASGGSMRRVTNNSCGKRGDSKTS